MAKRRVHYVLSTHWDREWYQAFQHYRYRLVQLLDHIIEGMREGRLKGPFFTDGQAILLEDYLEVRPERQEEVARLAQAGKLMIGPWYVLPDEFLVSGEALIRNLRHGRQQARALGAIPSQAGFACDLFGHNSQLPQIFAGFGIKAGFLWRGINLIDKRLFLWRGADGTEMPCYRFGPIGYCDYAFAVRHANEPQRAFDADQTAKDLQTFIENEAKLTETDAMLMFDGGDHLDWDEQNYQIVTQKLQEKNPDYEVIHSSLDAFLTEMLPQADRITTIVQGELREPGKHPLEVDQQWIIPGVLSSRVWIKQANAECQSLLCYWAEPLSALASASLQREYPYQLLELAWRWLLQNHPHDSICGCSIDEVHQDMQYRFSQCRQIGERLTLEAERHIAAAVEGEVQDGEMRLVLFNPLPQPISQNVDLSLHIPAHWPTFNEFFGFEPKPAFRIYNDAGEVPYQRLSQDMNRSQVRVYPIRFPQPYKTNDVRICLLVELPGMGYRAFTVRAGEAKVPTRHPQTPDLVVSERSMANEHLEVTVLENGTLSIKDKRSQQVFAPLLSFEDCADIGDGWYHGLAVNDQTITSAAGRSEVAVIHRGPLLATLRMRTTLSLPQEFDFDRMRRSEQRIPLIVDSFVTLRSDSDHLEVETHVENEVKDHRLRVLFHSDVAAEEYLADSPFDVILRPIALHEDSYLYRELEVEGRPQQSWTAVHDDSRGLVVISSGLYEATVCDWPSRPIALTLFRSFRRTVFTDGEPDGQMLQPMKFRYRIVPLSGEPDRIRMFKLSQQLAAGIHDVQLLPEDMKLYRGSAALPTNLEFLRLEGAAVMTSARQVGDALEVRLFNPNEMFVRITLSWSDKAGFTHARLVDLESNGLDNAKPALNHSVSYELRAKQIITVQLLKQKI